MTTPPLYLISGPSGAGEDSVIEGLRGQLEFTRVITTVTRAMRPGESYGVPYYFISVDEFKRLIDNDAFVEWALVYGDYRGCTKQEMQRVFEIGKPVMWKVDWKGVATIKQKFPQAISILIAPPSIEALEARVARRGQDTPEIIAQRRTYTEEWLKRSDVYDHIIVNEEGKLDQTIAQVYATLTQQAAS